MFGLLPASVARGILSTCSKMEAEDSCSVVPFIGGGPEDTINDTLNIAIICLTVAVYRSYGTLIAKATFQTTAWPLFVGLIVSMLGLTAERTVTDGGNRAQS